MTLDQAVDIQKAIDNRSISSDTLEFLEKKEVVNKRIQ